MPEAGFWSVVVLIALKCGKLPQCEAILGQNYLESNGTRIYVPVIFCD
jgi:hypothetical protein